MKNLKIGLVLFLSVCLLAGLSGCSGNEEKETSDQNDIKKTNIAEETTTEVPTEEWGIISQEKQNYYVVSKGMVDVRSGPLDGAPVLGKLHNGELVPVTGTVGHWSRIVYSDCVCYMDNRYLQLDPPNDSETVILTSEAEKETDASKTKEAKKDNKKDDKKDQPEKSASDSSKASPAKTGKEEPKEEPKEKHIVCIDAGHQKEGISEKEPNGPGSSEMKPKLAVGTQGTTTGVAEHVVNLAVSKLLEQELSGRGYEVIMIRENEDCPLSNAERAERANESGAEIFIRIHSNGSDDPDVNGAVTFAPSAQNPYVGSIASECGRLSQDIVDKVCETTGAKNLGIQQTDTMTGINWCEIPVTIIEMGFMTNPTEDKNLSDPDYQAKMAKGIADGVDTYFN